MNQFCLSSISFTIYTINVHVGDMAAFIVKTEVFGMLMMLPLPIRLLIVDITRNVDSSTDGPV